MAETTGRRLPNVHPGTVLRQEFLEELSITPYRLAKDLDVPLTRITAILSGKRGVTADTARRLGAYFGVGAQYWLRLQNAYDLEEAERAQPALAVRPRPELARTGQ